MMWSNAMPWGIIDVTGEYVLPPVYDYLWYDGGDKVMFDRDGKSGVISLEGEIIVAPIFDELRAFRGSTAGASQHGKWRLIDLTGTPVSPRMWDFIGEFSEGLAAVRRDGYYGFIDAMGNEVIRPQYIHVFKFSDNHAAAMLPNNRWSFIRQDGTEVANGGYLSANEMREGLAFVAGEEQRGFINREGEMVLDGLAWGSARWFCCGRAAFCPFSDPDHWGFLDKSGKAAVAPVFDRVGDFSEGRAGVKSTEKWGIIGLSGTWIVEPRYSDVGHCLSGLQAVETEHGWGFIGRDGNEVIPCQFSSVGSFRGEFAAVANS